MPDRNTREKLQAPYAQLNEHMHSLSASSPRGVFAGLASKQSRRYDPSSPLAYAVMDRRNQGRKLSAYGDIKNPGYSATRSFGRRGTGLAYVPQQLDTNGLNLGRPMVANHELEHAYGQSAAMPNEVAEIAPVLGDVVFGAESFRRQEGKPLSGKIPVGYKNQDAEWMRQQAQKHGYFDGRPMQSLLNTPAGLSYLNQAARGIVSQ